MSQIQIPRTVTQRQLKWGIGALVVGLLVFNVIRGTLAGGASPAPITVNGPGSQAVYQQIAADTDCASVQAQFDQAYSDNQTAPAGSNGKAWTLGYMEAAQARLVALHCP
jgi:hypothetical protein